ncbi:MAG: hypothetical protein JWO44_1322 [Bacteroidetes bacterium]|nr:hypothetical protein [Bacteroidota bacterium]
MKICKMKKSLTLLFASLIITSACFSQTEDEQRLLEKLNKEACEKLEKAGIKEKDDAYQVKLKLGMAFLPVLQENAGQIKKVWNLDINNSEDAKKAGEKIGRYSVYKCDKLRQISMLLLKKDEQFAKEVDAELDKGDAPPPAPAVENETITGSIEKIEGTDVSVIYFNTSDGEMIKLLWLESFSDSSLLEGEKYKGKKLVLTYIKKPIYQPKSKEYRDTKVITGLVEQ